jgi:hypothetical protein
MAQVAHDTIRVLSLLVQDTVRWPRGSLTLIMAAPRVFASTAE